MKIYCVKKTSGFVTNLSEEKKQVIDWVKENRNNNRPISTKSLLAYNCSVNKKYGIKKYNAQIKWIYRFIKRYGLSKRRILHIGQKLLSCKDNIINKFKQDTII